MTEKAIGAFILGEWGCHLPELQHRLEVGGCLIAQRQQLTSIVHE